MGRLSKVRWCLLGIVISILLLMGGAVFVPDKLNDAVNSVADNDFACKLRALTEPQPVKEDTLSEMVVDGIRMEEAFLQPVVVLKEKGAERYLPIWIGVAEANAIEMSLRGIDVPRPLTHDLLCFTINTLGANVDSIIINDIQDGIFYAKIILSVNWRQIEVDSRPSDAIATAVRVGAPIYAEKSVLDKAGIQLDHQGGKILPF